VTVGRAKQQAKLDQLLDSLRRGEHVQKRDLKTWLTGGAWAAYEQEVEAQKELRCELKEKPKPISDYEKMIAKANFAYNKGEGYSSRGKHLQAKLNFVEAEQLYERALEHLQEIIAADPGLCVWFDRDTSWTPDSGLGLSPTTVPLVVTSRSLDNRGGGILNQLRSKRDIKITVLELALSELAAETSKTDEDDAKAGESLKAFIKQLGTP
jgi:tetratricopeptide (TPR) repeat protein